MLRRLAPFLGTLLVSRATRKVAGRHAGTLALAFGAFELFRAYQRNKASSATAQSDPTAKTSSHARSSSRHSHRRRSTKP